MLVHLSRECINHILDTAQGSPDREICGLLLGRENRVTAFMPAANVATDPARRFEIDPAVLIAAHRGAREGGDMVLGHYHSHPVGEPVPSVCDAMMAHADHTLWLICGTDRRYGLWRAVGQGLHDQFLPMSFQMFSTDDASR